MKLMSVGKLRKLYKFSDELEKKSHDLWKLSFRTVILNYRILFQMDRNYLLSVGRVNSHKSVI